MSEEFRVEHRNHLMFTEGCPYCLRRARESGESPPPMVAADRGIFCLIHGEWDCELPFCYACSNHMIEDGICGDPRCRATNTPEVLEVVARIGRDAPIELLRYEVGHYLSTVSPFAVGTVGPSGAGGAAGEPASPASSR